MKTFKMILNYFKEKGYSEHHEYMWVHEKSFKLKEKISEKVQNTVSLRMEKGVWKFEEINWVSNSFGRRTTFEHKNITEVKKYLFK